jgi:transposase
VKGGKAMIMLGMHKRTHTVVAVDELGRRLAVKTTTATTTKDHLELIQWADQFGTDRTWAVEDRRHLSRRLEREMLAAGERLVIVAPKMMAHSRDSARAALREQKPAHGLHRRARPRIAPAGRPP